ncbi:biotin-dependent carboxyltransferase family protein [uncultured Cohaesibacter sp.]|uniref:5-oxoprolinase subunit C family protein n=1 Tax=uncultured Cohaesibacter sp. TaxID=1002546 RepID=UPI0029C6E820|nr:biotin-dependent carboxyltransferase family protein [uncultured Cohaesibacter sp.]
MNVIQIKNPGPMMTIQDLGRSGMLHAGVSRSGPMDAPSFRLANALVGNPQESAAIEFAMLGGSFAASAPVRVAVTGGAVEVKIDNVPVAPWESHWLMPGAILSIGVVKGAVWGYLAISGGLEVPVTLGSRSTHIRTGLGGLEGRCLQKDDIIEIGEAFSSPLMVQSQPRIFNGDVIRIVPGPQADYFDDANWQIFLGQSYRVSAKRDRMAQALEGPQLSAAGGHDIVSDGTVFGSIQVPGSGLPLVLMAERQTTGGYPKIATIATVDLPKFAQTPTGAPVRFVSISPQEAEDLLIAERQASKASLASLSKKPDPA